jgi:hypothetical protein
MVSSITNQMTDYEKARAWDQLQATFQAIETEDRNIQQAYHRKLELEKKQRQLLRTGRVDFETCGLCGMEVCNCEPVTR